MSSEARTHHPSLRPTRLDNPRQTEYHYEGCSDRSLDPRRCNLSQKNKIKVSAVAVGAIAAGSLAVGALAIGALAIGTLVVPRLAIYKGSLAALEIGELSVGRLRVKELRVEDNVQLPPGRRFDLQERV